MIIKKTSNSKLASLLFTAFLAACSSEPFVVEEPDSAPAVALNPDALVDQVPRSDPITIAGNTSPYEVFGKTYRVMDTSVGYSDSGIASWYGTKFHGRKTSNGESYNIYKLTAAHRSLPIPSYVEVTNLSNGKSAIVRVNDRGPFHGDRLIDLSYAAAVKLGFAGEGTTAVKVTALPLPGQRDLRPGKAHFSQAETVKVGTAKPSPITTRTPVATINASLSARPAEVSKGPDHYYVQLGAFKTEVNANKLRLDVASKLAQYVEVVKPKEGDFFRVRVGPMVSKSSADTMKQRLVELGFDRAVITREASKSE